MTIKRESTAQAVLGNFLIILGVSLLGHGFWELVTNIFNHLHWS